MRVITIKECKRGQWILPKGSIGEVDSSGNYRFDSTLVPTEYCELDQIRPLVWVQGTADTCFGRVRIIEFNKQFHVTDVEESFSSMADAKNYIEKKHRDQLRKWVN